MEHSIALAFLLAMSMADIGYLYIRRRRAPETAGADDGARWDRAPRFGAEAEDQQLDALYRHLDAQLSGFPESPGRTGGLMARR